jgi:thiamine-phosphate pyrophosphorylase
MLHAMKTPVSKSPLYGILDLGHVDSSVAVETAEAMLAGGVGILQLRAKGMVKAAVLDLARRVAPLCRGAGVPFIINDHPDLVPLCGADGVHIGQDDMSPAKARSIAGPAALIGLSTHSVAQARAAMETEVDYIGYGPLFATPTKPDYTPIGTAGIREVAGFADREVFCIGGITAANLAEVVEAGARRVVIVSDILRAPDITARCRECLEILAGGGKD